MGIRCNRYVFHLLKSSIALMTSDIDEHNARTANENVKLNQLESRIRVIKTDPESPLFPLEKLEKKR